MPESARGAAAWRARPAPLAWSHFPSLDLPAGGAEALEFVEKGAAGDAEGLGGFGAVEVVFAEGLEDGVAFHFVEVAGVGGGRGGGRGRGGDGGGADAGGEVVGEDEFAAGEEGGAFHGVAEFADVAGPGVALEDFGDGGGEAGFAFGEFGEETRGEGKDVLGAFAQGGEVNLENGEAVEEVFAEAAGFDFVVEVAVGGGEEARGGVVFAVGADALEASVLGDAEELGLELRGHLGDFVEEQGAGAGFLEAADALVDGTGEGAFFVTEEFGFEEVFWEGGAVHFHQRAGGAGAPGVDDVGEDFFADAAFAGDEDAAFGGGNEGGVAEDGAHEGAGGDDGGRERAFGGNGEGRGLGEAGGVADAGEEFVEVDGFGEVIDRAVAHGFDGVADVGVGGDEEDGERGEFLARAAEGLEAGHAGHADVGDHHADGLCAQGGEGGFAGGDGKRREALAAEEGVEQAGLAGVVIDDEDGGHGGGEVISD